MSESKSRYPLLVLISFAILIFPGRNAIPLTLDEAIERALEHNLEFRASRERLKQAEAKIREAKAAYFPRLDLNATYTKLSEPPAISIPGFPEYEMGEEENYTIGLSLAQPLFTSGRLTLSYRSSRLNYQMENIRFTQDRKELIFQVKKVFYSLLLARENLKLARNSLNQGERHLKLVEGLYRSGTASKFDLLRTRVEVAMLKPKLFQAEQNFSLARQKLANLLSLPVEKVEVQGELPCKKIDISLEEAIQKALKQKEELKIIQLQRDILQNSLKLTRVKNLPSLYLRGGYEYSKGADDGFEWERDWNLSLVLSFSLFDGGEVKAQLIRIQSELKEIELSLKSLEQAVALQVKDAFHRLKTAEQSIYAQRENVNQAKEALFLAELRYKNGTITNQEYLDAWLALERTKVGYLASLYEYNLSLAELERAMGE